MLDLVIAISSMQSVAIVTVVVCTQFTDCYTNTDILASSDDTEMKKLYLFAPSGEQ